MRNSQIALLSGLGVVLLGILAFVIALRVAIGNAAEEAGLGAETTSEPLPVFENLSPELENFDGLIIRSAWDIQLRQGDDWSVELDVDEDMRDRLNVGVTDGKLVLEITGSSRPRWFRFGNRQSHARITMPELSSLEVQGAANMTIDQFHGERLTIEIAGAANLEADAGEYENLDLAISGAANVDLHWVEITNANVNLTGAANVEVRMNGGELVGDISGFGRLAYAGTVAREDVRRSGFAMVERSRRRERNNGAR